MNDHLDCDPRILWGAHKAVIRGILIKHGLKIKKECGKQLAILLSKSYTVESRHKHSPTPSLELELMSLRIQITDLLQYKTNSVAK